MSRHSTACRESQALCEALFEALRDHIPELRRGSTTSSCGLFRDGWTRFAYVYHSKTRKQVEVWCRGDPDLLIEAAETIGVRPRARMRSGWEKAFPSRFTITRLAQVDEAARLLGHVSYEATQRR